MAHENDRGGAHPETRRPGGAAGVRGTWDDLARRLAGALFALDLHDCLVVAERVEAPPRRLLRRRGPRPPRRFVQVTGEQHALVAECVGSTAFGGEWEIDEETEALLLRQGWERPWSPEITTYLRDAPLQHAPALAVALARALQVLGCRLEDLEISLTRDESSAD